MTDLRYTLYVTFKVDDNERTPNDLKNEVVFRGTTLIVLLVFVIDLATEILG